MKHIKLTLALLAGLAVASATTAFAADEEITVTGTASCGKCTLKITENCSSMLKATVDGKEVTYLLTGKAAKTFHEKICSGPGIKVAVTGTVKEKDGKETLKATKIEEVK
jgi:type 1 fimbria pilin